MEIKQDLTPINHTPNGMKEIRGIVLHSMAGTYKGSIAWFKNSSAGASAHYCISKNGEITQCVLDKDMAWHAGIYDDGKCPSWALPNPNYYCIGIELEDEGKGGAWKYPEAEKKATAWLVDMLMKKYGIAKDHVLLHKDLNPSRRSDPVGDFSFDWVYATEPTPPVSTVEKLPKDNVLKDIYSFLCGSFSEDEIKWRLEQGKNLVEIGTDICNGDKRFNDKWVQPRVDTAVKEAKDLAESGYNSLLLQKEQDWQTKLQSANDATEKAKLAKKEEVLASMNWSELLSEGFKKLWIFRKSQSK